MILEATAKMNEQWQHLPAVLFFDGYCKYCNGIVNWLLRIKHKHHIHFSTLQDANGISIETFVQQQYPLALDSILVYRSGKIYTHFDAVLAAGQQIKGFKFLTSMAQVIPTSWRDGFYKWVARNRYGWFGKNDQCRMPSEADKARFL